MSSEKGLFLPEDPNITRFSTGHNVQRLTINETYILIEEPWLGDRVINDPFAIDFFTTPSFLRSLGLAQLLKSKESSTLPNVWSFNRGWGLIDQYTMVEHFGKMSELSKDEINSIHIYCEGDDQAHYAFSHKLEFASQKWGGPENQHEKNWPMIAHIGGTTAVLDKYGVHYDEKIRVVGSKIPEWAAASSQNDLDVDRLQYIATEALLWFDNDEVAPEVRELVKQSVDINQFEITPDGKMACKDPKLGLVLSKLLLLFASEHYNDPLARAQLHLDVHGVQRAISTRRIPYMQDIDQGQMRGATNYFYFIDQDFTDALRTGPGNVDPFIYLISNTLNASGMEERRRFIDYRLRPYSDFLLDENAENYPSEYLEPKRVNFGPRSSTVHTEVVELSDEQRNELDEVKIPRLVDEGSDALSYLAGPLKNRFINPLVRQGDSYVRLSEIKSLPYAKLLAEHQYLQTLGVKVTFAFTPEYSNEFREGMKKNDEAFNTILEGHTMTTDQKRKMIEGGARRAVDAHVKAGTLILKRELDV
ncbi:MAG: hypothetical protein JWO47_537 [Candidatus Saccharibacteria bacterium]|nr:hypothetical protein [Candidatus Saccharibacteria bacterium]